MAVVMTYGSLLDQIVNWNERPNDAKLLANAPTIISQSEFMLARELKNLLFQKSVTGFFTVGSAGAVLPKPARWREMAVFSCGTGTNNLTVSEIYPRPYSYCRQYAPDPTTLGTPKYYCDYQFTYLLVVSSPDAAYPYEMVYYESPPPLGTDQTTNQLTSFVPDLMWKAAQLTASQYLEDDTLIARYSGIYDRALATLKAEGLARLEDGGQDASGDT